MAKDYLQFKDKTYDLKLLKQAIKKASVVCIDAGAEFHKNSFELEEYGQDTLSDPRHPIVTLYEGKLVVIGSRKMIPTDVYATPIVNKEDSADNKDVVQKTIKPFKAILITKYNLNQALTSKVPVVDVRKPIYEPDPIVRRPNNPPRFVNALPSPGRVSQYGNGKPPVRK